MLVNLFVKLFEDSLLFSLHLTSLDYPLRLVADLVLNFLTTTLEFFSMFDLSLEVVLKINFILRKHFDRMVDLFKSLFLSIDFRIIEAKFF